jgi:hypothetical protein
MFERSLVMPFALLGLLATACSSQPQPSAPPAVGAATAAAATAAAATAQPEKQAEKACCTTDADCPESPGASCTQVCADGTNPCGQVCVAGACAVRGCPAPKDPSPPDVSNYAQSCASDDECVPFIFSGACATGACGCPGSAIHKSDAARYQSDLDAYRTECSELYPAVGCGVDCAAGKALCQSGKCAWVLGAP